MPTSAGRPSRPRRSVQQALSTGKVRPQKKSLPCSFIASTAEFQFMRTGEGSPAQGMIAERRTARADE